MNLARARSPEERPSTNTSVGRVTVDDPDGLLVQKTDRVGFIESYQFMEIRRFAKDALEWFARRRLQDAETRREVHRQESNRVPAAARADLIQQISEAMPADNRQRAMKALESLEKGYTKAIEATREDLLLYRSLATAGTTAAVFAHEIGKPISSIISSQKRIRARSAELKPREKAENLKGPLDVIVSQAEKLKNFSGMQIDFLRREKRRHGAIDVNSVISNLHRLWQPILKDAKISLRLDLHNEAGSVIFGAEALIETIITNCLTNAVRAFEEPGARTRDREVIIRSIVEGQTIAIEIEDNGPGFGMSLDDIWLPGKTTHHSGTGFGLTIAKDSALDLGGTYSATSGSRELGAKFRFVFQRFQSDAH
ncbi:sensor histidine kinase [Lysobacter enzymogenes]|uniref:histidine kinase n=2 Tax=Lysobacter enzymogenes TaxID=69 RepID=A0A3N2RL02_LYSEN|nr:sensor histidine kinase [Lysobacter enzymogenes]